MLRSAASKVMWVGRVAVFLVGLAVILALVAGVTSAAFAANGKPFLLGKKNVASAVSTLIKRGPGPALDLRVKAGQPPLKVNSAKKVARLNADKLDSLDQSAFLRSTGKAADSSHADQADNADTVDGRHAVEFYAAGSKVTDSDKLDGIDSTGFVQGGGRAKHGARDILPGSVYQSVLNHSPQGQSPKIAVDYKCPSSLSSNGTLRIWNFGPETISVFSDNGGSNPNNYVQLASTKNYEQGAAASGEHITLQVQGAGMATIEVFSVHRPNDCHVQAQGLFTYP